jgi:predicted dehydrogenase
VLVSTTTITTGLIGYGLSGRVFHAPFLLTNPAFDLTVISASDPARAADAATTGAEVVATPAELLERELDLVVLGSPAHVHVEQALVALEHGAAVVIDKPFVPSLRDAKALIAAAEKADRPLIVFHNRRWDGDFLTLRDTLPELGDVHRFESTFERWGTPKPGQWQETLTRAEGAGILFDLGSHLVDQALQLFGPATVEAAETSTIRGAASDDDAFLSLLHTSGVRSHLTMSRAAGLDGPRFRVLGSEGAFRVYGLDPQENQLRAGGLPTDDGFGLGDEVATVTRGSDPHEVELQAGRYRDFYAGVAATILEGAPPPVDAKDALEVVRIIERAHEIARAAR